MSYCEDYPCCGHEQGCCPSFNESGQQLNRVCTCGAELPVNNRVSMCDNCLQSDDDCRWGDDDDYDEEDCDDDECSDDDDYAGLYPADRDEPYDN